MILYIVRRCWDVLIGLLMIVISLLMQFLLTIMLGISSVGLMELTGVDRENMIIQYVVFSLVIAFPFILNLVACWEYFRKRRVVEFVSREGEVAGADSQGVSMGVFLVPRGIHRIFWGLEYRK